jgi:hypothetical protein
MSMQALNEAQARHLAGSLRAVGLGQLAAFGYSAIQAGEWVALLLSVSFYVMAEGFALLVLEGLEEL